jgi:hypothetical protein
MEENSCRCSNKELSLSQRLGGSRKEGGKALILAGRGKGDDNKWCLFKRLLTVYSAKNTFPVSIVRISL